MSIVKNNFITEGLSGKIGKDYTFVYLSSGKTILRKLPVYQNKSTKAQQAQRGKFKLAIQKAKEAIADPIQKENFKILTPKGGNIFGTAVKYFYALITTKDRNDISN